MIKLFSVNQLNESLAEREAAFQSIVPNSTDEGVLIQTCNRIEFYSGGDQIPEEIARHLFRVVSGLESSLVGEIAIQGQVKNAYAEACSRHKLSKSMHFLFQSALSAGKRVRTESGISHGAMSHSQAAAEMIAQSGINLDKAIISLIGAHKLNEDIIRFLRCKGAETIFLASRSFDKALPVAEKFNCEIMKLDQLQDMLTFSDILISSTAAPHLIVTLEKFPRNKPMLILDLAFPRDVDERIGQLPGVKLLNLENIERRINRNLEKRKTEMDKAESIIEEELAILFEKLKRQKLYEKI